MPTFDLAALRARRVVAILRSTDTSHFAATAETLIAAGVTALEFALTTPDALTAIRELRGALPDGAFLGAGTVLTKDAAAAAIDAGAAFFVTPAVVHDVLKEANRSGVPVLCGAYTATEVLAAHRAGALAVKIFPAGKDGAAYCRALREPLPSIPLVPTGGIGIGNAAGYLAAGVAGLGVGRGLIGDATEGGSQRALAERAMRLLEEIESGQQRLERGDIPASPRP